MVSENLKPRKLPVLLLSGVLCLVLSFWGLVFYQIQTIEQALVAKISDRADNTASVYAEVIRGRFRELDVAMLMLRGTLAQGGAEDFFEALARLQKEPLAQFITAVSVIGPRGNVLFSSQSGLRQGSFAGNSPFFLFHQQQEQDRLYIGASPSEAGVFHLSRRLMGVGGKFSGVLVFAVPQRPFFELASQLRLGAGDVLSLLKPDLTILGSYPDASRMVGLKLPESERPFVFASTRARLKMLENGRLQVLTYKALPELDLLIGVSLSFSPVLSEITRQQRYWWGLGGLVSLFAIAVIWGVRRDIRQSVIADLRLQQERERLGATLALAHCGIWEYSLQGRGDHWCPSTFDIFGVPHSPVPPPFEMWIERVHEEDRLRLTDAFRRCTTEGVPIEIEFRIAAITGQTERTLFYRAHRELDEHGLPRSVSGIVLDVTEARRLESSLREVEKRWQWSLTGSRDGVWDVCLTTLEAWFSPRWMGMLGYEPNEFAGSWEQWESRVHPDDLPAANTAMSAYLDHRTSFYEAEFRMRTKQGGWCWILSRGQAVEWNAQGAPSRLMGTHTDITSRKMMEQALLRERSRLAEAQALAHMGSWELEVESGNLWWSEEACRIFGFQPGGVLPSYEIFLSHVHPEDRKRVLAALTATLAGKGPYREEYRIVLAEGAERRVLDSGEVQSGVGGTLRLLGFIQDVTAQRQAEDSFVESEVRYHSLVAAMAEGIVVWDAEAKISFCNRAASRLLGFDERDLLGRQRLELDWQKVCADGRLTPFTVLEVVEVMHSGVAPEQMITTFEREGHQVWLSIHIRPLVLPGSEKPYGVLSTYTDVTSVRDAQINNQLAEAVVAATTQPIVVTDPEGLVVQANPAFCLMVGYEQQQIIGHPVGEVMPSRPEDMGFDDLRWGELGQLGRWEGEIWYQRRTGELVPQWLALTAIYGQTGEIERFVGISMDLTEHKRREEKMWKAANYDSLTDLPNRLLFQDKLQAGIVRSRRLNIGLGVLFVDLDRFKSINDVHGHRGGDLVLQTVARRMFACVREDDTLARLGGDEFMVLLQNIREPAEVEQIANKLLSAVIQPIALADGEVTVSCSIGYALFPEDGEDGELLVEQADQAMYAVKQTGRNGVRAFRKKDQE